MKQVINCKYNNEILITDKNDQNEEQLRELKDLGVKFIKTDNPETLLDSSYKYGQDGSIEVECHVRDKDSQLLTLTLYTDNEETAKQICSKWEKSSATIYQTIYDSLLS